MEKNELKKELMKNKVMAMFSHYCAGNLYYKVQTSEGTYQFPIATVESAALPSSMLSAIMEEVTLSSDLGLTAFNAQEKAFMFWRWIDKAIDAGEYVKVA